MINDEKVADIFADFVQGGQGGQEIEQIYNVMPYLNNNQQRVLTLYSALAVKYNSPVLRELVSRIETYAKSNRKLGFRFTRLIESMALYKHFKGYRATAKLGDDD
jgi:hypothetical protein